MVVKGGYRREGAGSLLVKHVIDYLTNKGVETIGLYAYPHLISFYESFDFKPDIDFLVLQGKAAFPPAEGIVRKAKKQDVPEVIDFDSRYSYVERPTEVEAYRYTVQEAKRIGLSDERICQYLRTKWINDSDFNRLAKAVNVTC